jgi:RimJ/RimL family protein N-acetyltransferase
MVTPTLTIERLTLCQIKTDVAPAFHNALSDVALMRSWSSSSHTSLAESEASVMRNAEELDGRRCWAITEDGYLRAESETHLGVRDSLIYGLLAGGADGAKRDG